MIKDILFSFLVVCLASSTASASSYSPNNTDTDGIGYRSNLIDPLNPYVAEPKRMFWTLLGKYHLVENAGAIIHH